MDLEHKYGDDGAQALYLWRFAGASFGLERRFWWTLLGALLTGAVTALGAVLFNVVVMGIKYYGIEDDPAIYELYKTLMDERMNRILNILTLVTSAFLPAQFMSGLYGMNFVNIPELELKWGYYAWWGIVLFLSANVIGYFHRNRLI